MYRRKLEKALENFNINSAKALNRELQNAENDDYEFSDDEYSLWAQLQRMVTKYIPD